MPKVLILEAGNDELVPKSHGTALERKCRELGLPVTRRVISGALHTEVMCRLQGRAIVSDAVRAAMINSSRS